MIKEFRGLYDYIRILGEHVVRIQDQIETIEKAIYEIKLTYAKYIAENKAELTSIHENMVTKSDLSNFLDQLKGSMRDALPPLPMLEEPTITPKISQETIEPENSAETTIEPPKIEEPPLREAPQKVEEPKKETKKRRFPFLRW